MPALTDAAEPLLAAPPSKAPPPQRLRILVVDDNRDAATTLAMLLQIFGHDVSVAHDGEAAIEAAARMRPDVALLDIGLPKVSGYEAARRIRAEPWGQDMLLIASTGWGQDDDRRKSKDAGFDHHMVKPVDFNALKALLASANGRGT